MSLSDISFLIISHTYISYHIFYYIFILDANFNFFVIYCSYLFLSCSLFHFLFNNNRIINLTIIINNISCNISNYYFIKLIFLIFLYVYYTLLTLLYSISFIFHYKFITLFFYQNIVTHTNTYI